jgi:hypothetical protein
LFKKWREKKNLVQNVQAVQNVQIVSDQNLFRTF